MNMILKIGAVLFGVAVSTAAYAACTTHTYYVNGKMTTCTTCCTGNMCNTTCY